LIDAVLQGYNHVLACETTRDSTNIYDLPAPRGKTAVIVGNEERGIPRSVLKKADRIVQIPMKGKGMSSVNVAVASALTLYALTKDLARQKKPMSALSGRNVDILVVAPEDPSELGSLIRSAWAFGWRRLFVSDKHQTWFTIDHQRILAGRAAARRSKNPIVVLSSDKLNLYDYDAVVCSQSVRQGMPLSKLRLPSCRRLLVVYGESTEFRLSDHLTEKCYVDYVHSATKPVFRHEGSILLAMIARMLKD
jgi:tRNA C32,U32 (ribose-2'-O)-methylase TrmJ